MPHNTYGVAREYYHASMGGSAYQRVNPRRKTKASRTAGKGRPTTPRDKASGIGTQHRAATIYIGMMARSPGTPGTRKKSSSKSKVYKRSTAAQRRHVWNKKTGQYRFQGSKGPEQLPPMTRRRRKWQNRTPKYLHRVYDKYYRPVWESSYERDKRKKKRKRKRSSTSQRYTKRPSSRRYPGRRPSRKRSRTGSHGGGSRHRSGTRDSMGDY